MNLQEIQNTYAQYFAQQRFDGKPDALYQSMNYAVQIGGKRIRPLLVLIAADILQKEITSVLPAAHAIEVFHNFTLVHDDIMDKSPQRRGEPTLYVKTDEPTAILAGDALIIKVYDYLNEYKNEKLNKLLKIFNHTALQVCEGQQLDMIYEKKETVSIEDYLAMIQLKTSVLLGASMQMGAICADADPHTEETLYQIGLNLGMAFQMMDDYLDTFGDDSFGKKIGGDILNHKKTFLYLHSLGSSNDKVFNELKSIESESDKIKQFQEQFQKTESDKALLAQMKMYHDRALQAYHTLELPASNPLLELMNLLFDRKI